MDDSNQDSLTGNQHSKVLKTAKGSDSQQEKIIKATDEIKRIRQEALEKIATIQKKQRQLILRKNKDKSSASLLLGA